MSADILNSWKEVAVYMGRGVRTVQRWERELHLPVRRPRGRSRSAVIAIKGELDEWLLHSPVGRSEAERLRRLKTNAAQHVHVSTAAVTKNSHRLLEQSSSIQQEIRDLHDRLKRTLALASRLVAQS